MPGSAGEAHILARLGLMQAVDLDLGRRRALLLQLLNNMGAQPVSTGTRQATLEAMGYVCEEMAELKPDVLSPQEINMILTAVVAGMVPTEPNESRLAATIALGNAIEFAQHNFDNESERNYLMQVCSGASSRLSSILCSIARTGGSRGVQMCQTTASLQQCCKKAAVHAPAGREMEGQAVV